LLKPRGMSRLHPASAMAALEILDGAAVPGVFCRAGTPRSALRRLSPGSYKHPHAGCHKRPARA
jgi:hypothetical protein